MSTTPTELLLPLSETTTSELMSQRWMHLTAIAGVDPPSAQRLARAFTSLAAIYRASEDDLVRAVGPVVASRLRWFLDAPLDTGLSLGAVSRAHAA